MNRFVVFLLRSPLRWLLSGRLCVLRYTGRVSGHTYLLPVEYVRSGDRLIVVAGRGAGKTWWRNFREPHRLTVLLHGRWQAATGTAHLPGAARHSIALARYRERDARVPVTNGDPIVVLDLVAPAGTFYPARRVGKALQRPRA